MWARAYSQWAAEQLGGEALTAPRSSQIKKLIYQWPDEEFATLRTHVESAPSTRFDDMIDRIPEFAPYEYDIVFDENGEPMIGPSVYELLGIDDPADDQDN